MQLIIEEKLPGLLYSPISTEYDSRPAEITTFQPENYPDLTAELNEYSANLSGRDDHRLIRNYTNLNFFEFPAISIWRNKGSIVGFATIWDRSFFPKGSVRLFNRLYHDREKSRVSFTRELVRPSTFHCMEQQLVIAKRLGFEIGFITREMRAQRHFRRFIAALDRQSSHSWEWNGGPFLVAPAPAVASCWQSIGATQLADKDTTEFWSKWQCQ
jgi:hypothetical protein